MARSPAAQNLHSLLFKCYNSIDYDEFDDCYIELEDYIKIHSPKILLEKSINNFTHRYSSFFF